MLGLLVVFAGMILLRDSLSLSFLSDPATASTTMPETMKSMNHDLAYQQSFGFFDDIPDSDWKHLQQIKKRTWPNHFETHLETHSGDDESNMWNAQNFQEEFHCSFSERIPSTSDPDGSKWVCDPHRIAQQPICLVFSIGSSGNTLFERGVRDQISADCEIHTFDVDDYTEKVGDVAVFHHWGIGTTAQAEEYERTKLGKPFKSLAQTVRELGHEGRTIDIFKIDCEG